MFLGALLATLGFAVWHAHVTGRVGPMYIGGAFGVLLFFVGLVTVIRGR